jgi:hypothetical protein
VSRDPLVAAAGDLRPLRLVRATPAAVWLLVALHGFLALAYALAVPLLHAPDEPAHVDLLFQVDDHLGLDPYAGLDYSRDVEAALPLVGMVQIDWRFAYRWPWDGLDPSETVVRSDRPAFADLSPGSDGDVGNPAASHPPGYYALVDGIDAVAQGLGAAPADTAPWDALVLRWRLWSVLVSLPLPWLVFWTAVRVSRHRTTALAATLLVLAVPQLSHSAGSVNNDALLFPATAAVTLAATWIATGDRSWLTAGLAGLAAGVAMITKIFGLGAPVWLLAAFGYAAWRQRDAIGAAASRLAVTAVVALLAGGWWPLRLIVTAGTPAPRDFRYPIPDEVDAAVLPWLGEVVRRLSITSLGWFGIEQFRLPVPLVAAASIGILVAIGIGAWRAGWLSAVLLLPALTTLAMVLYAAWGGYTRSGLPSGLHGRYLFVGLAGLAALAAMGLAHLIRRTRALLAVAMLLVVGMQAIGLWVVTTNYWAGVGLDRLRALVVFSAWSGRTLAVIALLAGATAVAAALVLHREATHPQPSPATFPAT